MRLIHLIAQELKQGKEAFRRFPLSMIFAIAAAIFQCMWLHRNEATVLNASPILFSAVAVIGFFLATAAYLYLDTVREKENFHGLLIGIWLGVLLFLVVSGFRLASMRKEGVDIYFAMPTLVLLAASGLMVFCGGKIRDERRFPAHVLIMIMEIAVSYLYAFVLFAALCLLVVGADVLFGVVDFSSAVMYLATICFMPFMATIFLSRLSAVESGRSPYGAGIHVINNLFNNILAPVLGLYVLLLYLYMAKIVFLHELPTTSVVNLILWPMALAVFVLFMVDRNRDRTGAYYFRKAMPPAALPLWALCTTPGFAGASIRPHGKSLHDFRPGPVGGLCHGPLHRSEAGIAHDSAHDLGGGAFGIRLRRTHQRRQRGLSLAETAAGCHPRGQSHVKRRGSGAFGKPLHERKAGDTGNRPVPHSTPRRLPRSLFAGRQFVGSH